MITAHNKITGVTKEFSPYEWSLMQDWPNSPWSKINAKAPDEATKAAKAAGDKKKAEDKAKAALEAKAATEVEGDPGNVVDENNPPVL